MSAAASEAPEREAVVPSDMRGICRVCCRVQPRVGEVLRICRKGEAMLEYTREGLLELTKKLVSIRSISHTAGENEAAAFIYESLAVEPYFQKHPDFLRYLPVEEGGLERRAVMALVRAGSHTRRTVLLNGHFDVVDTDVCGDLAEAAFDAAEYTRLVAERDIPEDARADLASGNWLFGRGVMDMKAGIALHMAYLAHMARHPGELGVNLLFLAVPDEEGSSAGMRGSLPGLCALLQEQNLELEAALSGEPAFWTSKSTEGSRPTRTLFTGTTGKLMPLFFCVGREAHAGYSFDGVNAAALAARVVSLMDCRADLMDGYGDDTLTPPVCLKLKDLRDSYSVTLPERAAAYFNVLSVSRSPLDILHICREVARQALEETLEGIRESGRAFQQRSGRKDSPVPAWESRVLTMSELMQEVAKEQGGENVQAYIRDFVRSLPADRDEPEKGLAVADYLVSLANLKGPAIVVGFLPPYYPQRLNTRATAGERRLRSIMEGVCADLEKSVGSMRLVECFSGIMDLSYMGFQGKEEELRSLADNMPGWGSVYDLPMKELLSLNVPIASVGPAGKDAHKDTERLELHYSLEVAPRVLERVIRELGEDGEQVAGTEERKNV